MVEMSDKMAEAKKDKMSIKKEAKETKCDDLLHICLNSLQKKEKTQLGNMAKASVVTMEGSWRRTMDMVDLMDMMGMVDMVDMVDMVIRWQEARDGLTSAWLLSSLWLFSFGSS